VPTLRSLRPLSALLLALAALLAAPVRAATPALPPQGPAGWEKEHSWVEGGVSAKGAVAVLFVHGLGSSTLHFRAPTQTSNVKAFAYDNKATPKFDSAFDVELSPPAPKNNWFDGLGRSYKVASWNQVPCLATSSHQSASCQDQDSFENAYRSAPWALRKLLDETTGPIALVGHSRGGLIIRRLLKEFGDAGGRIKWVVTLHTPHHGADYATALSKLDGGVGKVINDLPKKVRKPLTEMHASLADTLGAKGGLELGYKAKTSLFPKLEAGEKKLPGVVYKSYGGNSTISVRVYIKAPGAKPRTVDFFTVPVPAEMHNGSGDAMVTDASAHFPKSFGSVPHVTQPLHHGEILWHQPTIDGVRALLAVKPAGY
jgi:pimeloyl-ACP methyl ester carboxylesterase